MKQSEASRLARLTILGIMIFALGFGLAFAISGALHKQSQSKIVTASPLGYVQVTGAQRINMYVFTDPDTDKQYIVTQLGGICPREDRQEPEYYE
jgi:hypothetical protein